MNSLIKLDLGYCYEISMLPEFGECMKKLSLLDASCTAITKLPESLGFLTGLQDLGLSGCENIDLHPFTVKKLLGFNLMSLTELNLSNCGISDGSIPDDFGGLTSLFALDLGRNDFVNLPIGCFCNLHRLHYLFLNDCKRLKSLPKLPPRLIRLDAFGCDALEPLSDRQLWNVVSSLDHEYRHQTKYTNSLIQHDELEYLPQRDFLTIITALEVPSWFQNKDYVSSYDYSGEFVLMVDIPQYFRASEWSGLAVCLNIQSFLMSESVYISWSSKAPEDDNYICKDWSHVIGNGLKQGHHLCLMLLHLNDKTCWQHLRGDDSCLHIKLSLRCALLEDLVIVGCGWRVLCKDEMKEWGSFNDFSKSTKAEAGASKVCLPDSVIHRTIKNFQGEFGIPVEAVRQAHFTHFKEWHGREKINS
ncbi:TMV resistance protein N-like isoform X2 [Prosopis cineraria]|uniref:TMV resistance protein N-like isoform X2 n=1 Tax=Prosopis cineraria TaxID=364024 RepID=UPI00240F28AB|nr:TMV resistance protein N-like isoform X2 [Prosopis cineraria]XP_054791603.1 TMV resistance protein N-like isoform X2 [Prosopis cineraria]